MTTNKKEHLSALLDSEAGSFEQRRLTDEISKDKDMEKSLINYALIGESMRATKPSMAIASNDFLARLNDELDKEEPLSAPVSIQRPTPSKGRLQGLKPVAGLALAASIAAVSVVGVQNMMVSQDSLNDNNPTVDNSNSMNLAAFNFNLEEMESRVQQDPELQAQLRHYVNEHSKYSSLMGIVPTVRAASYNP